jgi:hypothetical protein
MALVQCGDACPMGGEHGLRCLGLMIRSTGASRKKKGQEKGPARHRANILKEG